MNHGKQESNSGRHSRKTAAARRGGLCSSAARPIDARIQRSDVSVERLPFASGKLLAQQVSECRACAAKVDSWHLVVVDIAVHVSDYRTHAVQTGDGVVVRIIYMSEGGAEVMRSYGADGAGLAVSRGIFDSDDNGVTSADVPSCGSLAERFGLTEREAEILELVAMGRSAQYIADDLTISYNTVWTHIKHVYQKLNIHSKQELIDLVRLGA